MTELMALDPPTEAILGWSILNEQWFFKIQVFEGGAGTACLVHSFGTVNLRSQATINSQIAGLWSAGMGAIANQKTVGEGGLV